MNRREVFRLVGAAGLSATSRLASAQGAYPGRPVRILAGFAAGGGVDITARLMGQWLSERLGQPFVTENRTGADGNIATEAVVNAPADGYTLLRDISPIAGVIRVPMVALVHPSVPATTIPELIAYAKDNPGKLNMASAGTGSAPHMAGELFNAMAGVNMVHIPYRGQGPALSDLLGGQVQILFAAAPGTVDYIKTE